MTETDRPRIGVIGYGSILEPDDIESLMPGGVERGSREGVRLPPAVQSGGELAGD